MLCWKVCYREQKTLLSLRVVGHYSQLKRGKQQKNEANQAFHSFEWKTGNWQAIKMKWVSENDSVMRWMKRQKKNVDFFHYIIFNCCHRHGRENSFPLLFSSSWVSLVLRSTVKNERRCRRGKNSLTLTRQDNSDHHFYFTSSSPQRPSLAPFKL